MKLSMWMIANRLKDYEIEIDINTNAKASLKSVRFTPVEHCVYIVQKEKDVICIGEDDRIILHNMSVENAFEVLADIFDFYDDWEIKMREYAENFDFENMIDICWQFFNNPIIFLGNNKKVLEISKQYGIYDVNDEWQYINLHGHVSIESLKKTIVETTSFYVSHIYRHNSPQELDFMSCPVIYNNVVCGRIVIIEKDRKINVGDEQLLNHLVSIIAPIMMRLDSNEKVLLGQNTLYKILKNYSVSIEEVESFLKYLDWTNDDILRVCVLSPKPEDTHENILLLLQEDCFKLLPEYPSLIFQNKVIIIFNETSTPYDKAIKHLKSYNFEKNMTLSVSLPFKELRYIKIYWQQAISAVQYGKIYKKESHFYDFYDYALDYIIDSGIEEETLLACHPDIIEINKKNPDSLITLAIYLNNKCSLLHTADELFIHRNTLVYRIKKITEGLRYSIDDSYTREYISLSIRILSLFNEKLKIKNHNPD